MEYLALLLPVCLCWRARHLLAATIAAALIIAAAGSARQHRQSGLSHSGSCRDVPAQLPPG